MIESKEADALAELRRIKASYQSFIKSNYEHRAEDCRVCPTQGACCTDAHFVNVHITRLEAVHLRDTLERTPRLTNDERRAVYLRAKNAVARYNLSASGDTFKQTYACPLFQTSTGCLVHQRAKPAPCIQHACYENWEDLPPMNLQTRAEHRIEQLNRAVYGAAWSWLPTPLWLCLVDPLADGAELERLARGWSARSIESNSKAAQRKSHLRSAAQLHRTRRSLPVLHRT